MRGGHCRTRSPKLPGPVPALTPQGRRVHVSARLPDARVLEMDGQVQDIQALVSAETAGIPCLRRGALQRLTHPRGGWGGQ